MTSTAVPAQWSAPPPKLSRGSDANSIKYIITVVPSRQFSNAHIFLTVFNQKSDCRHQTHVMTFGGGVHLIAFARGAENPRYATGSSDLTMPFTGVYCHPWARNCNAQPSYQIWSLYLHRLWRYERQYNIQKMGWFGVVRSHSRSLEIAPFNIVHVSSYLPSITTTGYVHGWSVAWHSGRMSVFGWQTFPVLCLTCSWWVTIYLGKPSTIGQPTRPTQPFIPLESIEVVSSKQQLDVCYLKLGVAPSGERLRRKGRHGVICR